MRVHNFAGLVRVILVINKQPLYFDKCRLIRNDQDLGIAFLGFSMHVHNFAVLVSVILVINKQCLYYDK